MKKFEKSAELRSIKEVFATEKLKKKSNNYFLRNRFFTESGKMTLVK